MERRCGVLGASVRAGVAGLGCLPALSHGGRVTSAWCPRLGISASWSVRVKRVVGKRPAHSPHAGCAAGAGLPRRASRVAPSRWTAARLPPGPCGGPAVWTWGRCGRGRAAGSAALPRRGSLNTWTKGRPAVSTVRVTAFLNSW